MRRNAKTLLNMQGAKLNVPQEEMPLNMDHGGGAHGSEQIPLGLGLFPLTGNAVA